MSHFLFIESQDPLEDRVVSPGYGRYWRRFERGAFILRRSSATMGRIVGRRCHTLTPTITALAAPTYALARPHTLERFTASEAVAGLGDVGAFRLGL